MNTPYLQLMAQERLQQLTQSRALFVSIMERASKELRDANASLAANNAEANELKAWLESNGAPLEFTGRQRNRFCNHPTACEWVMGGAGCQRCDREDAA